MTNENGLRRIASVICSHHSFILVVFLICTIILGLQTRYFKIETSADTLLMRDNKHFIETQITQKNFSPQEFLLVVYKPKNHALFSKKTFGDLEDISQKLLKMDRVETVRSILNVPLFLLSSRQLSSNIDSSSLNIKNNDYTFEELKGAFKGHPIYEDLLINKNQTATGLQLLFKPDNMLKKIQNRIVDIQQKTLNGTLTEVEKNELLKLKKQALPIEQKVGHLRIREIIKIYKILSEYEKDANFYLGGVNVLSYQFIKIIKNDLIVFGSAIGAMICLILFIIFRKIRWVIIPLICCACSVICTIGLFGFLGFNVTVISANFISLQLILTLAIVLHLIDQYRQLCVKYPDWEQEVLVRETLFMKMRPCFYAGITTSIGFGSLIFSNFRPVIDFGWMMIIATVFSSVVSLILFPALVMLFRREKVIVRQPLSFFIIGFLKKITLNYSSLVIMTSILFFSLSIVGILKLNVENSFINYFRKSTLVRKELSFIDKNFGGSTPLDLVYTIANKNKKEEIVLTADTIQELQRIQYALQKYPASGKILSIVNLTELALKLNNGKPLTEYELTSLYWTMEDSLRDDLLGSLFSPERSQVLFSLRIKDTTEGLNRSELISSIRNDLQKLNIPKTSYLLSNMFILYQDILSRLFRSQIMTLGIVSFALMLTFLAIFRSFKVALIGVIPNSISTLFVLGFMGWFNIPLDLMTITIAAIAMGIAVDDTIYFIHCYLDELKNHSATESIENCFKTVGYAILYTSVIIILGFLQLAFSDFIPSILFGILTSLAMLMALVSNLSLLPIMLRYFIKQKS